MSVGIIGLGTVGSAMFRGFRSVGLDVFGYDADPVKSHHILEDVLSQRIVLISLPTPTDEDGSCDLSALNNLLEKASHLKVDGLIVIRSTIPVGTTDQLMARYPSLKIGFSPEFLRERFADYDFMNPPFVVYGGNHAGSYFETLRYVHGDTCTNQIILSTTEAELLKLTLNGFAALKTVFASELAGFAKSVDADWSKVVSAAQFDGRMGKDYLHAEGPDQKPGFGGNCLPKDCRMLIEQLGNECLLASTLRINARLREGA